jgi:two-component system, LytTR family, sensor kinase
MKAKSVWFWHVIVWLSWTLVNIAGLCLINPPADWLQAISMYLVFNPVHIACVYMNLFGVWMMYGRKQDVLLAAIAILFTYTIYTASSFLVAKHILSLFPMGKDYNLLKPDKYFFADNSINFIQYLLYAFFYWHFTKRVQSEKKLRETQTEKLALENEKLRTEYKYLQSQINPHFLYNTLDYFYAEALQQNRASAEGIAILSHMMRYSLATGDKTGKVWLEQEVEQIHNYITLQQLRFGNQLHIQFSEPAELPRVKIIPHTCITLVENAFKYGVTNDAAAPLKISLQVNAKQLVFQVENKISHQQKDSVKGGIGLQNLQQRLNSEYPDRHTYEVINEGGMYKTVLTIEPET